MNHLPTGTVTYLFTDIEGSTKLLQRLGERYAALLDEHGTILRAAIAGGRGIEVNTEGDAFFAVFRSATDAVTAATAAQRALAAHPWDEGDEVRVRMGLHSGEAVLGGDDYIGIDVNRAARIAAAGHGGQVLLSDATRALVQQALPEGVTLRDLGDHRLKDLTYPEHLYQLAIRDLPSEFPEPRTLDARPNNLPVQLTRFIGRREVLDDAIAALDDTRLLTLTGPGGTGKTRLGLQLAAERLLDFADGAFFVDLSSLFDAALVPSTIAEALGVHEEPARPIADTLSDHLRDLELLLVLDNFEQVTDAAPAVQALLVAAPKLRVVVTSRTALHLYGERELPVPPLVLPDPEHLPSAEALSQYEAVALFIDRAVAVKPGFGVTNENAPAVAEICARLDGLPLAIELAASRVKVLTPQAILSRLEHRLRLLTGGARDLPDRQRTLRGAVDWSYDLLDEDQRTLFARSAVFMGGCTIEAAEAVCNPGGELNVDTLDGLASLVDESLVRQTESSDGEPRFVMLETIREYATERLEDLDAEGTRRRHAEYFLAFAEEAQPNLIGGDMGAWLDRCEREHDNVRAALRWAISGGDLETGMGTAAALWRFWQLRGHLAEGRAWLDALVDTPGAAARTAVRARAVGAAGSVAYWQEDYEAMKPRYEEALEIAREVDDRPLLAEALFNYSYVFGLSGDRVRGREVLTEVVELYEELGDRVGLGSVLGLLAYEKLQEGLHDDALEDTERAIELIREGGSRFDLAESYTAVGQINRLKGDHDEARAAYRQSLAIFRQVDNPSGVAMGLDMMATSESAAGLHERALRLSGAADAIQDRIGGRAPQQLTMVTDAREEARKSGALDDEEIERLWNEGRALEMEKAIELAMEDPDA